jgi:hypothetical protein
VVHPSSLKWLTAVVPIAALAGGPSWHVTPTKVEDYPGGFRCYFWNPSEKPDSPRMMFQTNDENGEADAHALHALIGINGAKIVLDRVDLRRKSKKEDLDSVGDQLYERFTAAGIEVVLDATVTRACPADSENCEVTEYRAKLKVTKDGGSRTIEVVGDCGV